MHNIIKNIREKHVVFSTKINKYKELIIILMMEFECIIFVCTDLHMYRKNRNKNNKNNFHKINFFCK